MNTKEIDEKLLRAQKEIDQILENYGLELEAGADFPRYKILPDVVKLALAVFKEHGGVITVSYKEKTKHENKT